MLWTFMPLPHWSLWNGHELYQYWPSSLASLSSNVKTIHYNYVTSVSWRGAVDSYKGPSNGPLARYIKLRVAHAPGMPGTFSPPPRVSDPGMHSDTCVTHVPWCMPGSLTNGFLRSGGENVPSIPGACATRNVTYLVWGPCGKYPHVITSSANFYTDSPEHTRKRGVVLRCKVY